MGKAVVASDQYALGITVYEWLAGKQPFHGSFFEVCAQHLHAPVPSLREANPDISPDIEQCILRALEKEPEKRFASIRDFATALQEKGQLTLASSASIPADYVPTQQLAVEELPDFQARQSSGQQYNTPRGSVSMLAQTHTNPSIGPSAPSSSNTIPPDLALTQAASSSMPPMNPMNSTNSNAGNTGPQNTRPVAYSTTEPPFMPPVQLPPYGSQPMYAVSEPRRQSNKRPLILACFLLAILLIFGSVLAVPSISSAFGQMLSINNKTAGQGSTGGGQHKATAAVTSTQTGRHKNTNSSQATPTQQATATATPAQQAAAPVVRTLSSTKSQSSTVNATGQGTTQATQATGSITINDRAANLQLPAGTTLTNVNGCTATSLQIQLDNNVNLTAGFSVVEPIHVVQAGASGNIQDCNGNYAFYYCNPGPGCDSNLSWNAHDNSGGFSGGTDAQTYTAVSQYDVDKTAAPLKQSTQQYAISDIQQQVQSNEHLEGDPQCTSTVTSDPAVGAKAAQVTVTVSSTCTQQAST